MATAPILLISTIFVTLFFTSSSQTCANHNFTPKKIFISCKDLPVLNSHLHWSYFNSTKLVAIAFRATPLSEGWVSWAINPYRRGMVGSQALVAVRDSKGRMSAYATTLTGYNPSMQPMKLSFRVSNLSAEYVNNELTIRAILGPLVHGPVVNHVWQVGSLDPYGVPQMHALALENLQSTGVIDFSSSLTYLSTDAVINIWVWLS